MYSRSNVRVHLIWRSFPFTRFSFSLVSFSLSLAVHRRLRPRRVTFKTILRSRSTRQSREGFPFAVCFVDALDYIPSTFLSLTLPLVFVCVCVCVREQKPVPNCQALLKLPLKVSLARTRTRVCSVHFLSFRALSGELYFLSFSLFANR